MPPVAAARPAAVVAIADDEAGLRIQAHLATKGDRRLSIIKLKEFCSERLPVYMVPDSFAFHESLPKTSTGKIDYQALQRKSEVAVMPHSPVAADRVGTTGGA